MQYAPLHGLEPVGYMRHGTFQNYITGIVEKPVFVHSRKLVCDIFVLRIARTVVGVLFYVDFAVFVRHNAVMFFNSTVCSVTVPPPL